MCIYRFEGIGMPGQWHSCTKDKLRVRGLPIEQMRDFGVAWCTEEQYAALLDALEYQRVQLLDLLEHTKQLASLAVRQEELLTKMDPSVEPPPESST